MDKTEILNLPMRDNDADAKTIGDYLTSLLWEIWTKEESFSGKRPFGNSGWKYDLYSCLVQNEIIEGSIDENGDVEDYGPGACEEADKLIGRAIVDLC